MKFHPTIRGGAPIALHSDRERDQYCTAESIVDNILGFGAYQHGLEDHTAHGNPDMPSSLYKYRKEALDEKNLRYLRQLVVLDTAYISNLQDFNDPFDGKFQIKLGSKADMYETAFRQLTENSDLMPRRARRTEARRLSKAKKISTDMPEKVDSLIRNHIGVLCMSTNPGSILMWTHYASDHKGILLEYETRREPFFFLGDPVKYSKDFPEISLPVSESLLPFVQKSIEWQYEEEFRIITRVVRCGVQLQPSCLTGITLGARCSPKMEAHVIAMLDERQADGKPRPILKRAHLSNSQYALEMKLC